MWFEKLVGFKESNPEQVRKNIEIVGNQLISKVNNHAFVFGSLETPSLEELRNESDLINKYNSEIKISEIVGNIQNIHQEASNKNALIQVASQFNLLEMVSPDSTPEEGVGIYEYDGTQGPACAIACGAGTIFRNYFVNVDGQIGQTSTKQIDCLHDIGIELENEKHKHWEMKNGYALATRKGLTSITQQIKSKSGNDFESLKGKLRIGVQWDSEVTLNKNKNPITQVYCSALPVSYSEIEIELWSEFAKMILEATYEATFHIALKNYNRTGNNKVFLTLIGGGAFGNRYEWIFDAIRKSIDKFSKTPLDVKIVSYSASNPAINAFIDSLKHEI
ncbi:hypothetical protein [Gelidibacter maritimus]|nr:hypothetical protein [Gelidibacter maritimus]